jgi:hypothetical protein
MVSFGRLYGGGGVRMFGSPIESPTTIRLTIRRAVVKRDLAQDWYHGRDELIEVRMSPAQFAELITNMNVGDGIPCTLVRVGGERQPECPQRHVREEIVDEFKSGMADLAKRVAALSAAALDIVNNKDKKTLTNADRDAIRAALGQITRFLTDSGPFIHSQFDEAMDKTVNAAKAEVAAAITTIAHGLGLRQMADQFAAADLGGPLALPAAAGAKPIGKGSNTEAGGNEEPSPRDD